MFKSVSFVLVWMIYLVYISLYYPVVGASVVKNVQGTVPAFICFNGLLCTQGSRPCILLKRERRAMS